jgi:hypothetical protein
MILGIDPGKSGALAWRADDPGESGFFTDKVWRMFDGNGYHVKAMPMVKDGRGRPDYDLRALARMLDCWGGNVDRMHLPLREHPVTHVFIERQQALPAKMGGTLANYARGYGLGVLEAFCVARGLSYELVAPRTWQTAMLADIPGTDTKARARAAVRRLFPVMELPESQRLAAGYADAVLLAEWGARKVLGARPEVPLAR